MKNAIIAQSLLVKVNFISTIWWQVIGKFVLKNGFNPGKS